MGINNQQSADNSDARLNLLGLILNLGHESYKKGNIDALFTHILTNSRVVSAYDMSCIIDMRSGKPKTVSLMGTEKVIRNTEYCNSVEAITSPFHKIDKVTEINQETLTKKNASDGIKDIFDKFLKDAPQKKIFLVPMPAPGFTPETVENGFLWFVEYYEPKHAEGISRLNLLSMHYGEAVWYFVKSGPSIIPKMARKGELFHTKSFWFFVLLIVLLLLFVIRIGQNVSAEFEIVPKTDDRSIVYAPFQGKIAEIDFYNGQKVKPGDIILEYNTQELNYQLKQAQAQYDEASAKLDMVRQRAFNDIREIANIKLLTLEQSIAKIAVEKYSWMMDKSILKAELTGTLIISDPNKLKGKAVADGEKLFEIIQPSKTIYAEVYVNEGDSSVISHLSSIALYLHSRPELSLTGKIVYVDPVPILTDKRQYCYVIRIEVENPKGDFLYGMRGVARVTGEKVTMGYYIFRNLILWWRKF